MHNIIIYNGHKIVLTRDSKKQIYGYACLDPDDTSSFVYTNNLKHCMLLMEFNFGDPQQCVCYGKYPDCAYRAHGYCGRCPYIKIESD